MAPLEDAALDGAGALGVPPAAAPVTGPRNATVSTSMVNLSIILESLSNVLDIPVRYPVKPQYLLLYGVGFFVFLKRGESGM